LQGLADLQVHFEQALRGGRLPEGLTARDPAEAERRFNVYRNNVIVSLTEALAVRFPVIERLVGAEFFRHMARIHAETERPATPVMLQWGRGFAAFLADFAPLRDYPYMADVARIEYCRGVAYHAADRDPVRPDLFADADPACLRLGLHPSVSVLHLEHAAVTIWAANQPGMRPGRVDDCPQIALILRDSSFNVPVRAISAGDAAMIGALGQGRSLLEAAELAQARDPSNDAASLLMELMAAGAIVAVEVSPCAN